MIHFIKLLKHSTKIRELTVKDILCHSNKVIDMTENGVSGTETEIPGLLELDH